VSGFPSPSNLPAADDTAVAPAGNGRTGHAEPDATVVGATLVVGPGRVVRVGAVVVDSTGAVVLVGTPGPAVGEPPPQATIAAVNTAKSTVVVFLTSVSWLLGSNRSDAPGGGWLQPRQQGGR